MHTVHKDLANGVVLGVKLRKKLAVLSGCFWLKQRPLEVSTFEVEEVRTYFAALPSAPSLPGKERSCAQKAHKDPHLGKVERLLEESLWVSSTCCS